LRRAAGDRGIDLLVQALVQAARFAPSRPGLLARLRRALLGSRPEEAEGRPMMDQVRAAIADFMAEDVIRRTLAENSCLGSASAEGLLQALLATSINAWPNGGYYAERECKLLPESQRPIDLYLYERSRRKEWMECRTRGDRLGRGACVVAAAEVKLVWIEGNATGSARDRLSAIRRDVEKLAAVQMAYSACKAVVAVFVGGSHDREREPAPLLEAAISEIAGSLGDRGFEAHEPLDLLNAYRPDDWDTERDAVSLRLYLFSTDSIRPTSSE
jgi:hypothetical protein